MKILETIIARGVLSLSLFNSNNLNAEETKEVESVEVAQVSNTQDTLSSFTGTVSAYTPYCDGCIGITASSYNVLNTMYYDDQTYGTLRIIAADQSIPFGTIIKMSGDGFDPIISIVLDRGSAIGNDKRVQADLLFSDYSDAINFGIKNNVLFEILRYGY